MLAIARKVSVSSQCPPRERGDPLNALKLRRLALSHLDPRVREDDKVCGAIRRNPEMPTWIPACAGMTSVWVLGALRGLALRVPP